MPSRLGYDGIQGDAGDSGDEGGRMKSKLATLNKREDKAWVNAFEYYKSAGKSDTVADKKAWEDLRSEFPRLKQFKGAKA